MAFPSNPSVGQQATESGRTYAYAGNNVWNLVSTVAGHASTHSSGAADAVSIDASQVTTGTLSQSRVPGMSAFAASIIFG